MGRSILTKNFFFFFFFFTIFHLLTVYYTGYAGCAVTTCIAVNFGTAHGRSRPEVGSTKRIDVYGRKGVTSSPRNFGTS